MACLLLFAAGTLATAQPVLAQTSTSFKLEEHAINAGGKPSGGVVLQSASYTISLHSIGAAVVAGSLNGSSFRMSSGLASSYPPPGEVTGLVFTSKTDLVWDPEKSVGVYNLYRGLVSGITPDFGNCQPPELTDSTATDANTPPANDAFFYLVTAENLLDEEGTKGSQSSTTVRDGAVCP
jgi:hypothetical protein